MRLSDILATVKTVRAPPSLISSGWLFQTDPLPAREQCGLLAANRSQIRQNALQASVFGSSRYIFYS
jgi:hypothetical protein